MKNYILLSIILALFFISINKVDAQNIEYAEYFIDNDPGVGNATNINITSGEFINHQFTIDISSFTDGIHRIAVRVRNVNQEWCLNNSSYFFITGGSLALINEQSSQIIAAEYFINEDPGIGNGNNIAIIQSNEINTSFNLNINDFRHGLNRISIRVKDTTNRWSLQKTFQFIYDNEFISSQTLNTSKIITGEFFLNNDPGIGNGTPLTLSSNYFVDYNENINLNLSSLFLGDSILCIRTLDEKGKWGLQESYSICNIITPINAEFSYVREYNSVQFISDYQGSYTHKNWNFGDGTLDQTLENPLHTFNQPGEYDVRLSVFNICDSITINKTVQIPGLSSITPNASGNYGFVQVDILGFGLSPETNVTLKRSGVPDINPDSIIYNESQNIIKVIFNLKDKPVGVYDVVVQVSSSEIFTLTDAFTIESCEIEYPSVQLSGRPITRPLWNNRFDLVVSNNTCREFFGVPIWLDGIPNGSEVVYELIDSLNISPFQSSIVDSLFQVVLPYFGIDWDSIPAAFLDSVSQNLITGIVIPRIRPYSTISIPIFIKFPFTGVGGNDFSITASLQGSLMNDSVFYERSSNNCGFALVDLILSAKNLVLSFFGFSDAADCALGLNDLFYKSFFEFIKNAEQKKQNIPPSLVNGNPVSSSQKEMQLVSTTSLIYTVSYTIYKCISAGVGFIPGGQIPKLAMTISKILNVTNSGIGFTLDGIQVANNCFNETSVMSN